MSSIASREGAPPSRQRAQAVLMVRPAAFGYNPETALTNAMQHREAGGQSGQGEAAAAARAEFDAFAAQLAAAGIRVCVAEDSSDPPKPDAVFPNNWVSFHEDGTLVLYPMQAESRRPERRQAVLDAVVEQLGFKVTRVLNLIHHEDAGRCLEGTGSLVLDHGQRVAYACLSPRTHPAVVEEWGEALGYQTVVFSAHDRNGVPIYHTNVLMSIGEGFAVVGSAAIEPADRARVLERLGASGRQLIEIDQDQIAGFAGNVLELATQEGRGLLVMSVSARQAFGGGSLARLEACTGGMLVAGIPTIEHLGGGSARCMLAEVFVP
jgi:hypothetical protein